MGTQKVGGFQNIGQRILDRFRTAPSDQEPRTGRAPADRPDSGGPARTGDRVEISGKAREMMKLRDTVNAGREALERSPEVRQERLAEVKSRLGRGYYESPVVHERVATRVGRVLDRIDEL
jgi:hypothetical protein